MNRHDPILPHRPFLVYNPDVESNHDLTREHIKRFSWKCKQSAIRAQPKDKAEDEASVSQRSPLRQAGHITLRSTGKDDVSWWELKRSRATEDNSPEQEQDCRKWKLAKAQISDG